MELDYSSPLNFDEYATPHRPRTPGLICIPELTPYGKRGKGETGVDENMRLCI